MDRLETQMRELTGRVEEVMNQIEQMRHRIEQINGDSMCGSPARRPVRGRWRPPPRRRRGRPVAAAPRGRLPFPPEPPPGAPDEDAVR